MRRSTFRRSRPSPSTVPAIRRRRCPSPPSRRSCTVRLYRWQELGERRLASLAERLGRDDAVARRGGLAGEGAKNFQLVTWNRFWPGACYTKRASMWNQPAQGPFRRFAAAQVDGTGGVSAPEEPGEAT